MKIFGLQPMTLLDYPEKVAATVFLGGCDLRCPYCHNAELWSMEAPSSEEVSEEDFFSFLEARRGLLDGVCVSGGEPLLHRDLKTFLSRIRAMGFLVKLDTNGTHPDRLQEILSQHLVDFVAMDVKHAPERYAEAAGIAVKRSDLDQSIHLIMEHAPDYLFRTTLVREFHDEASIASIAAWVRGAKRFDLQLFQPSDFVPDPTLHAPNPEQIQRFEAILKQNVDRVVVHRAM